MRVRRLTTEACLCLVGTDRFTVQNPVLGNLGDVAKDAFEKAGNIVSPEPRDTAVIHTNQDRSGPCSLCREWSDAPHKSELPSLSREIEAGIPDTAFPLPDRAAEVMTFAGSPVRKLVRAETEENQ